MPDFGFCHAVLPFVERGVMPSNLMRMRVRLHATGCILVFTLACGSLGSERIRPVTSTAPLPNDADDPAFWRHPRDAAQSLILGTDKAAGNGGLWVFGLDGTPRQTLTPLDRPNTVDVEYGVSSSAGFLDIAVVTERLAHRLRVYQIPLDGGGLVDLAPAGLDVASGTKGDAAEPMGVALYRRPRDGAVFAVVAPKGGPADGYLRQYRLTFDPDGVSAALVRRFGSFSGLGPSPDDPGEIEAVVVDDDLGFVYYADERFGLRKWHADPDHPDAARELAVFGRNGYLGDREGLALYREAGGRGVLVSSDQVPGGTRLMLYPRQGRPGPGGHDHPLLAVVPTSADDTDGLDVTSGALPGLPRGAIVMMNSQGRNFLLFDWRDVEAFLAPSARRTSTAASPGVP